MVKFTYWSTNIFVCIYPAVVKKGCLLLASSLLLVLFTARIQMAGFTQILLSNLPFDDIKCHRSRKNKECLTGPPSTAIRDATVEALSSQIPLLMESLKPTKVSKSNDVIKQHLHYNPGGIPHLESCLQSSADDYDEFTGDIAVSSFLLSDS